MHPRPAALTLLVEPAQQLLVQRLFIGARV